MHSTAIAFATVIVVALFLIPVFASGASQNLGPVSSVSSLLLVSTLFAVFGAGFALGFIPVKKGMKHDYQRVGLPT